MYDLKTAQEDIKKLQETDQMILDLIEYLQKGNHHTNILHLLSVKGTINFTWQVAALLSASFALTFLCIMQIVGIKEDMNLVKTAINASLFVVFTIAGVVLVKINRSSRVLLEKINEENEKLNREPFPHAKKLD